MPTGAPWGHVGRLSPSQAVLGILATRGALLKNIRRHEWSRSGPWCKGVGCLGWLGSSWEGPQFQGLEWGPPTCPKPINCATRWAVWVASEGQDPIGALIACTRQPQFLHLVVSTSTFGPWLAQACMRVGCRLVSTNSWLHTRKSCLCMQLLIVGWQLLLKMGVPGGVTHLVAIIAPQVASKMQEDQHLKCLI